MVKGVPNKYIIRKRREKKDPEYVGLQGSGQEAVEGLKAMNGSIIGACGRLFDVGSVHIGFRIDVHVVCEIGRHGRELEQSRESRADEKGSDLISSNLIYL